MPVEHTFQVCWWGLRRVHTGAIHNVEESVTAVMPLYVTRGMQELVRHPVTCEGEVRYSCVVARDSNPCNEENRELPFRLMLCAALRISSFISEFSANTVLPPSELPYTMVVRSMGTIEMQVRRKPRKSMITISGTCSPGTFAL
jgi:hypothetical protein